MFDTQVGLFFSLFVLPLLLLAAIFVGVLAVSRKLVKKSKTLTKLDSFISAPVLDNNQTNSALKENEPVPHRQVFDVTYGQETCRFPNEYVSFDVETTGLSYINDDIIDIAGVHVKDGEIVDTFSSLVKSDIHVNSFIRKLTGINDDMLASAPSQKEVIEQFLNFAGDKTLVAHNANFDLKFVAAAAKRHLNKRIYHDFVDTLTLARYINRELPNKKLPTLKSFYGIEETGHRALGDAKAVAKLLERYRSDAIGQYGMVEALLAVNYLPNAGIEGISISIPSSCKEFYDGNSVIIDIEIKQEAMVSGKNKGQQRYYFEKEGVRVGQCSMDQSLRLAPLLLKVTEESSVFIAQTSDKPSASFFIVR